MRRFEVTGMHCAACSTRIEKVVSNLPGVENCNVSLLTKSMTVEGSADDYEIINAVKKAGYKAFIGKNNEKKSKKSLIKLICSAILLLLIMYFSMGHNMLNLPLPEILDNYIIIGIVQALLSLAVIIINNRYFINGFKGILHFAPNMDTLVALGSGVAYIYSIYMLFVMIADNNAEILHGLYFESAAMILTLITVGKTLEEFSKGKTVKALELLQDLKPETAVILTDNGEKTISSHLLKAGDIFVLRPGDSVPADGEVIKGETSVNESSVTGESIPKDKTVGDKVTAGTVNISGYIECKAEKVGDDTLLSGIIKKVFDVSSSKAPIARIADRVAAFFVPAVTLIAIITFAVWIFLGKDLSFAVARAISVLVISCPCSLGLATPVAITVGSGIAAKNGVLFKNASALEMCGRVNAVALDKTGTVTTGKPIVTDVIPLNGITDSELLRLAVSLEIKSKHPLATAITQKALNSGAELFDTNDFEDRAGFGITAEINNNRAFGGNLKLAEKFVKISCENSQICTKLSQNGKTPMLFGIKDKLYGIIAVADSIREDSKDAVSTLNKHNVLTIMLTGDNEKTAEAVANEVGIKKYFASALPNVKAEIIEKLKQKYTTAMVGDGINDALALTTADIGIAIGCGSDIATESADVILLKNSLNDVTFAIMLSRKVLINIKENLFWAFFYNTLGIPIAAGVLIPLGITLNPMIAAACMGLSSVCVVTNALRLNKFRLNNKKEKTFMKTLTVEGMMCEHCEARVKKVLEELPGVISALPNHSTDTVTVQLSEKVSDDILKSVIENEGYKVIKITE